MADNPLNAVNRGVYISDNLPFLQSLNDECVDLICIDPPFANYETFGQKNSQSRGNTKFELEKIVTLANQLLKHVTDNE